MDIDYPKLNNPNSLDWDNFEDSDDFGDLHLHFVLGKRTCQCQRDMQEIVPGVFLGPYSAANCSNLQYLLDHRITHIVCVRHITEANIIKPNFPNIFKYLVLDIADTETENIIQHFRKVKAFIDEGVQSGGRVLVHGNAGLSRSATLVMAYVMETCNLSWECAFSLVQQQRYCVSPNASFVVQLMEYMPIYKAYKTGGQSCSEYHRYKRTIHQVEEDDHIMEHTPKGGRIQKKNSRYC